MGLLVKGEGRLVGVFPQLHVLLGLVVEDGAVGKVLLGRRGAVTNRPSETCEDNHAQFLRQAADTWWPKTGASFPRKISLPETARKQFPWGQMCVERTVGFWKQLPELKASPEWKVGHLEGGRRGRESFIAFFAAAEAG